MAKKKTLPCAVCGELLWKSRTSLPAGQATCHPCRRGNKPAARLIVKNCLVCGGEFTSRRPRTRACSRHCGGVLASEARYGDSTPSLNAHGHKARAARFGVEYQPINRARVFERDDWLCLICMQPTERDAKWPDPLSPSLDHVVPLSRGGSHTYPNVQTTHLRCNLRKGASPDHDPFFEQRAA